MPEKKKRKGKQKAKAPVCSHHFAYCYYNKKEKMNVYVCTECGEYRYQ